MNIEELKEMIDGTIIEVPQGDAYLAMVKVGNEASISFEGDVHTIATAFVKLMKKYKDLASVICIAADAYEMEAE